MLEHVRRERPKPTAGLLAGSADSVKAVISLANALHGKRAATQFLPDPEDWNKGLSLITEQGLQCIGLYQSAAGRDPPDVNILGTWLRSAQPVLITVSGDNSLDLRAWSTEGEIRVATLRPAEAWQALSELFKTNRCLGMFEWIETVNSYFQAGLWENAAALLNDLKTADLCEWDGAREVLQNVSSILRLHPPNCSLDGLAFLKKTLQEPSPRLQREVILALTHLRAAEGLEVALGHQRVVVQMLAAGGLRHFRHSGASAFRSAFRHPHWFVRWQAVEHLALYGDSSDDHLIRTALADPDCDVVVAATRALSRRGNPADAAELRALLPSDQRDSNGRLFDDSIREALLRLDSTPVARSFE